MLCGWGPTRHFAFERQVGMIFAGQRGTVDANLCRDCALALGRSAQNRTLYTGWWGVFAFFTNMAVVARNAGQLRNAAKLRAPAPVAGVEGRIGRPLPPGNPVPRRAGMWFAALVIGAVAALGIGAASQPPPAPSGGAGGGSGGGATSAGWKVGSCIRGTTLVGPVPCSTRHDGEIIDATTTEFLCPPAYDGTVDRSGTIYCIDTDR